MDIARHCTHVERKGDTGVREHDEGSQFAELVEWRESFCEGNDACVDDSADRGVVVQGDDGIHLRMWSGVNLCEKSRSRSHSPSCRVAESES